MKPTESESCKRIRVRYNGESIYFTVGEKRLMAHFANESSIANAGEKEFLNLACRLVSKLRGAGVAWPVIIKQFRDVSMGYRTLVMEMGMVIEGEHGDK